MASNAAYIYVIEVDSGEVKVGLSGTPYARMSKIKREYGPSRGFTRARLCAFVGSADAMLIEGLVHRALKDHASGGEWYRLAPGRAIASVVGIGLSLNERLRLFLPNPDRPSQLNPYWCQRRKPAS